MPEDESKAAEYFEKSGDWLSNSIVDIPCHFGDMYRYGESVKKNIVKAIKWYEIAVFREENEMNDSAKFALAEIYRDGEGGI